MTCATRFAFGQRGPGTETPLVIGLVNNMGLRAMRSAERQFRALIRSASNETPVELKLFTLHDTPPAPLGRDDAPDAYSPIDALWDSGVDALIVTGMEPRMSRLQLEPSWKNFARLIDWATRRRIPTVWSCLAAHAAVCYLDGIERVPLTVKRSGIFRCHRLGDHHPLMTGMPRFWDCAHSRSNDLPAAALVDHGYEILSRSDQAGVDIFTRSDDAPALFFQGHPEYAPDTLLREYLRDVQRYLNGEGSDYPTIPTGYLDEATTARLLDLRSEAKAGTEGDLMTRIMVVAKDIAPPDIGSELAVQLYRNWLGLIRNAGSSASTVAKVPAHAR